MIPVADPNRTLRPIRDVVIVRRDPAKTQAGLLYIPESAQERWPEMATVVAVGPGKAYPDGTRRPVAVQPGDRVYIPSMTGQDWNPNWMETTARGEGAARPYHPQDLVVLHEREVIAVVEGEVTRP